MSHYFESGFFVEEPAWHRLGTVLENSPSKEEAIHLARLDWEVTTEPLFLVDGTEIDTHYATRRSTDHQVLGVVGNQYTPYQNYELFDWCDFLLHDGDAGFEAAGSLMGGRKVWILLKLTSRSLEVKDGDIIKPYFLLSNSHDGSSSLQLLFTFTRVVCWNTLSAALSQGKEKMNFRHMSGITDRMEEAKQIIDFTRQSFNASVNDYRKMETITVSDSLYTEFVGEVFKRKGEAEEMKDYDKLVTLFHEGAGNVGRSAWDAYNSITEYTNHVRGRSDESRLNGNWFGEAARINQRAHKTALALA